MGMIAVLKSMKPQTFLIIFPLGVQWQIHSAHYLSLCQSLYWRHLWAQFDVNYTQWAGDKSACLPQSCSSGVICCSKKKVRKFKAWKSVISRFYQRRLQCMQTANRFSAFLGLILKVGKTWARWYFCSLALCDRTPWRNIHTSLNTSLTIKKSLKPSDQSSLSTALFPTQ